MVFPFGFVIVLWPIEEYFPQLINVLSSTILPAGDFEDIVLIEMTKIYRNIYEFVIVLYASLRLQLIFTTSCSRVNFFFLFVAINVIVKQLSWPGVLPSWLHDFVSFM